MEKKEAMKILKDFHDKSALFSVRTALETLHPELKESEDERMVNQLHSWMNEFGGAEEYTEKVYQWLKGLIEKQGEQKPTDEDIKEALRTEYEKGRADAFAQMQQEWSEEDEKMIDWSVINLSELMHRFGEKYGSVGKCIDWHKSLKERYTWKPSEEQIDALADALSLAKSCGEERAFDLRTLYEQLEKLKGE